MAQQERKFQKPNNGGGPGAGPRGGYGKPKNLRGTILRMFSYLASRPLLLVLAVVCVIAAAVLNIAASYICLLYTSDAADE